MKTNNLLLQLFYIRLARVGFTGIITLLSWSFLTSKAQAMFGGATPSPKPPSGETPPDGSQGVEGIFNFREFNLFENSDDLIDIDDTLTVDSNANNPNNVVGGGNLLDIVNAAAGVWNSAFPNLTNDRAIEIGVGWADFGLDEFLLGDSSLNGSVVDQNGVDPNGIVALYIHGDNNFPFTEQGITGAEELDGLVLFNSQLIDEADVDFDGKKERILLYLDENPLNSDVFGSLEELGTTRNLTDSATSSVDINFGRSTFRNPGDFPDNPDKNIFIGEDDIVIDAFTVALHELQHALGLSRGNPDALDTLVDNDDSDFNLLDLPTSKGNIPTTLRDYERDNLKGEIPENSVLRGSLHIFDDLDDEFDETDGDTDLRVTEKIFKDKIATPVGFEFITNGERKCPSEADVRAVAAINGFENGFENPEFNPCKAFAKRSVPEPSTTIPLIMVGIGGLLVGRKRLSKNQPC